MGFKKVFTQENEEETELEIFINNSLLLAVVIDDGVHYPKIIELNKPTVEELIKDLQNLIKDME